MSRQLFLAAMGLGWLCLFARTGAAQNVSDYSSIDNPYLLLLREPAVWDDLHLDASDQAALQQLNDRVDGPLLALRNWPAEKASPKLTELCDQTRSAVSQIFDDGQRERLDQIVLRVRGIKAVLTSELTARLNVTDAQRSTIETILAETRDEISALFEKLRSGSPQAEIEPQVLAAREREQRRVFGELTDTQKRRLAQAIGRPFDLSRLGKARFKAPEFTSSSQWLNSRPFALSQLRGQVVAVHFWAFGCINCRRNFPWYRDWQDAFAGRRLTIVGIHTPETEAERNVDILRRKIEEAGFKFPVLADNDKSNWNAWGNSMWPSVYLVDKQGYLRYWWYGELDWKGAGGQKIIGKRIEELLAE